MKRTITKLVLLLLAVLTTGSVNAATETYDFTGFSNNTILESGTTTMTINGNVLYAMETADNTFNGRFAVGPSNRTGVAEFVFKNWKEEKGFKIGYAGRFFSILNLEEGDKVTITTATGSNMKFSGTPIVGGDVTDGGLVTSGTAYTVSSAGNLNLAANADGTYIQSIVIETSSVSVPVTINVIPDVDVENYDFVTKWYGTDRTYIDTETPDSGGDLVVGTETFGNRFSVSRAAADEKGKTENGFLIRGNSEKTKGLYTRYENRNFTIKNLSKDDKIVITWHCDNTANTSDDGKFVFIDSYPRVKIGEDGTELTTNTEVISGQEYIVTRDDATVAIRAKKGTSDTDPYVSITAVQITPKGAPSANGTYIGATLVSSYALDFTNVEGITAYVATAANAGCVTFSKVTKVAANTPLYIKANATSGSAINVEIPEATEGAVDYSSTNLLKGSATAAAENLQSSTEDDGTHYYLFGVQGGVAGFYHVPTTSSYTSAAGKAYLQLTTAQAQASPGARINMVFDDSETTGINMVQGSGSRVQGAEAYYNLAGQRVAQPTRGLYIVNGKKVIIK